jgi:hypothetical protein
MTTSSNTTAITTTPASSAPAPTRRTRRPRRQFSFRTLGVFDHTYDFHRDR